MKNNQLSKFFDIYFLTILNILNYLYNFLTNHCFKVRKKPLLAALFP